MSQLPGGRHLSSVLAAKPRRTTCSPSVAALISPRHMVQASTACCRSLQQLVLFYLSNTCTVLGLDQAFTKSNSSNPQNNPHTVGPLLVLVLEKETKEEQLKARIETQTVNSQPRGYTSPRAPPLPNVHMVFQRQLKCHLLQKGFLISSSSSGPRSHTGSRFGATCSPQHLSPLPPPSHQLPEAHAWCPVGSPEISADKWITQ